MTRDCKITFILRYAQIFTSYFMIWNYDMYSVVLRYAQRDNVILKSLSVAKYDKQELQCKIGRYEVNGSLYCLFSH